MCDFSLSFSGLHVWSLERGNSKRLVGIGTMLVREMELALITHLFSRADLFNLCSPTQEDPVWGGTHINGLNRTMKVVEDFFTAKGSFSHEP